MDVVRRISVAANAHMGNETIVQKVHLRDVPLDGIAGG